MEIRIKVEKNRSGILNKLTAVFFGIFLTSLIFALSIKLSQEIGLYVGLGLCAVLIFLGFYFIQKGKLLRYVAWAMLITILISGLTMLIGLQVLEKLLEGF